MAKKRIVVRVNQYGKDMEIRVPGHWAEQGQEVTITVRRFGHEFRMLSHARGTCYWRKVTAHQDILRNMGVQDGDRVVILNGPVRPDILFVGTREGRHLLRVAPVARELELGGGEGLYHVEVRQLTVRGGEALERVILKVKHAFGELRPGIPSKVGGGHAICWITVMVEFWKQTPNFEYPVTACLLRQFLE